MTTCTNDSAIPPSISFRFDSSLSTITNEQLSLIGFTAHLGACVNNDDTDSKENKSVRNEAMLLMSLLMGKKVSDILSEEIGVKEEKETISDAKQKNRMGFAFTFPVLSLQPDVTLGSSALVTASSHSDDKSKQEQAIEACAPSQLLGRTQSVYDKEAIRDSSEAMARNVLESFGAALIWRAKTWINSLVRLLAIKVSSDTERRKTLTLDSRRQSWSENDTEDEYKMDQQEHSDDGIMNSREMQIIESIVKSSEEVYVVNVKTSFRVLSQIIDDAHSHEVVTKKLKTDLATSVNDKNEYKVVHKLVFEATVSMTSNEGDRYKTVKLQAPGIIEGTFMKSARCKDVDENLIGVSIKLDTDALALSLERQSRCVVRRAAEAALMSMNGMEYRDVAHVPQSVISPRYVLLSPIKHHSNDQEPHRERSSSPSSASVPLHDFGMVSPSEVSSPITTPSMTSAMARSTISDTRLSPSLPALLKVANAELYKDCS